MDGTEESILWDLNAEYSLRYILDNFSLPQIVRVVEGYMFTEDDCLSTGTILTLHGLKNITKITGYDEQCREMSIPIDCPYKLKLTSVNDKSNVVYHTVNELCQNYAISQKMPQYLRVNKKFSCSKMVINTGVVLRVEGIVFTKTRKPKGVKTSWLQITEGERKIRTILMPPDTVGDFTPSIPPEYQEKAFLIKMVEEWSCFPITVKFVSENMQYGPQLGKIQLEEIKSKEVIIATSSIQGIRYVDTFPSNLPVTIQVSRSMLEGNNNYKKNVPNFSSWNLPAVY